MMNSENIVKELMNHPVIRTEQRLASVDLMQSVIKSFVQLLERWEAAPADGKRMQEV